MEKQEKSELVYDGKLLKFYRDDVLLENGGRSVREIVKHPGGVCIAAYEEDGSLWFVRQIILSIRRLCLSFIRRCINSETRYTNKKDKY